MEHHGHSHADHRHGARNGLKAALVITATFLVAEFLGALYTNSLALLADSGHMLTDVAALSLSLAATWFATRRATPQKTFGFYRLEILAALLNGILLILIALYIFYEAYGRLTHPEDVKAGWMVVVAVFGLLSNLCSAYLLFGIHDTNLNVRGAFFHVLSDTIGSLGAVVAGLVIMFGGATIADPLISMVVGLLILSSSWILLRDAVDILLEGTPAHVNIVLLQDQLREVEGVGSIHDLHVWTLSSGVLAMSCHVVMAKGAAVPAGVLKRVRTLAREHFKIDHTTVQIEESETRTEIQESCNCHFGAWDVSR